MTTRIWHQSYLDLGQLPGYAAMLGAHARTVCGGDTVVDLHGVETGDWPPGVYVKYSGQGNHLKVAQIVDNAVRAEAEGYDAVALSVFLDPGLEDARALVDIPVVSALETALEVGAKLGRAMGLVTRARWMNARVGTLVRRYGYADRVAALEPLASPMGLDDLDRVSAAPGEFIARFTRQASSLIQAGVDVLVPAEGLLNTVLVRNGVHAIEGVPVLDSYGALLAHAEMLVRIRRASGRAARRERIPQPVEDQLRRATAAVLLRPLGPA